MPIARVKLPSGRIAGVDVPEGTSAEQVQEYVAQNLDWFEQNTPAPKETGFFPKSIIAGAEGFSAGVRNRLAGTGQAALSALESILPGEPTSGIQESLRENIDLRNLALAQNFPENKTAASVGQAIGDLAMLAPAAAATPGGIVLQGAVGGGIEGITRPEVNGQNNDLTTRAMQGGIGAAGGAAAGKVLQIGGGIVKKTASKIGQKLNIGPDEFMGKVLGVPDTDITDILSNIDQYGINQNFADEQIGKVLGSEAKRQSRKIGTLYSRAKSLGDNAFIEKQSLAALADDVANRSQNAVLPVDKESLANLANQIRSLADSPDAISVNNLQTIRSAASKASKGSYEAGTIARNIDDFVLNGIDQGLISGDKKTGQIWKQAIAARRNFSMKFEEPQKIVKILGTGSSDEIGNALWGANVIPNPQAGATYNQVLKSLPSGQRADAETLMKKSIIDKIVSRAADGARDTPGGLSADQIIRPIEAIKTQRPELWKKFTMDEQKLLNNLVSQLQKAKGEDAATKTGKALFKFGKMIATKNVELPTTMKPKDIYSVEDLIALARTNPEVKSRFKPVIQGLSGSTAARMINFE